MATPLAGVPRRSGQAYQACAYSRTHCSAISRRAQRARNCSGACWWAIDRDVGADQTRIFRQGRVIDYWPMAIAGRLADDLDRSMLGAPARAACAHRWESCSAVGDQAAAVTPPPNLTRRYATAPSHAQDGDEILARRKDDTFARSARRAANRMAIAASCG